MRRLLGVLVTLMLLVPLAAPGAGAQGAPIKIGVPVPLSGGNAKMGDDIAKAATLAAEEANAKGGLLGRKVEIMSFDDACDITLVGDKCKVNLGCALADHVDVGIADGAEQAARDARRELQVIADDADNGFLALDVHLAYLMEVALDGVEIIGAVERHRHRHFGSRHHIDGGLMPLEDFKDGAQESMRHQHARRGDVDDRHAALESDGLDQALRPGRLRNDERALATRIVGVEDVHRNALLDRRHDG